MPRLGPVKRADLIRFLRLLGFEGPFSGGKHQFMRCGERTRRVPNPHQGDIGRELSVRIPRQGGIDVQDWEDL